MQTGAGGVGGGVEGHLWAHLETLINHPQASIHLYFCLHTRQGPLGHVCLV